MHNARENVKPIRDYLQEAHGAWVLNHHGDAHAIGVPDIIACVDGRFMAIEVKRPSGGKTSRLQIATLHKIGKAGGAAFVASSVEEVAHALNSPLYGHSATFVVIDEACNLVWKE